MFCRHVVSCNGNSSNRIGGRADGPSVAALPSRGTSDLQIAIVLPACSVLSLLPGRISGLQTCEYSLTCVGQIVPEECQRVKEAESLWQGGGDNLQLWSRHLLARWATEDVWPQSNIDKSDSCLPKGFNLSA